MSLLAWCLPCIATQPKLSINRAQFTVLKLLGEGGFSYVYEVQASNGAIYALKKIRCPFGAESVKKAMTEVHNYQEFHSPYIVRAIDSSVVQEEDGSKTVYILLPYFEGSLQDMINSSVIDGTQIDEAEAVRIFIGLCRGVQAMHRHSSSHEGPLVETDDASERDALLAQELDLETDYEATELQEHVAYAHKDIKPANVMLSKDGMPVLCDLGSCSKARIEAKTRSSAVAIQELAAEHCTLPYRAPELLDVQTGTVIDEKIDVWSLGCTLYALLYGSSPFEREESLNGASINMAIANGTYSFPEEYSDAIKGLIKMCLVVDPQERPNVEQVLARALELR